MASVLFDMSVEIPRLFTVEGGGSSDMKAHFRRRVSCELRPRPVTSMLHVLLPVGGVGAMHGSECIVWPR